MIDIKCNGRMCRFHEGSEILNDLDMRAVDVFDDPHDTSILTGKSSMHTVYTRETAVLILEAFQELLIEKDITIPCTGPDEKPIQNSNTARMARLCGVEYDNLRDQIEDAVIAIIDAALNGAKIVRYTMPEN